MRVIIRPDTESVSAVAADFFQNLISKKPNCVLGLATGSTPLGLYKALIDRHKEGKIDFANVTTFNLDEYVGLSRSHDQSYYWFMKTHLFDQINVPAGNWHVPDAQAADAGEEALAAVCSDYEQKILDAGGVDLQLLGIGADGHIGFNEPGSSLASRTRLKALTTQTRQDNSRFFANLEEVPKMSITMGIGTILDAKMCLLMATGENKAEAVRDMIEGPVSSLVPASSLQMHQNTVVVLDQPAAKLLKHRDYYQTSEELQQEIQ